ncbi:MAG: hypothetical protein AABY46_07280 [Nitrospirota bacterium]
MATVSKTTNELLRGPGVLLIANQGTLPTEELGYHKSPIKFQITTNSEEDTVEDIVDIVDRIVTSRKIAISGAIAQANMDALARILAVTKSGEQLSLSGDPEELELAVRVISSTANRKPVHLYLPRAKSDASLEVTLARGKGAEMAFNFGSLYAAGAYLRTSNAIQDLTIAVGSVTRVQAAPTTTISWLRLAGEGAAADDLTIVAEAGLTDGEIIRVCIFSAAQPITIKHAAGLLVLKTAADFVMTSVADWIDLYYDTTGSAWKEIARYDAN